MLDLLDPDGKYITKRLYRENCTQTDVGVYLKDLRILDTPLEDIVLVDNAAYSFGYQLENGIPILPFYDDPSDLELEHLIVYLETIAECEDLRE